MVFHLRLGYMQFSLVSNDEARMLLDRSRSDSDHVKYSLSKSTRCHDYKICGNGASAGIHDVVKHDHNSAQPLKDTINDLRADGSACSEDDSITHLLSSLLTVFLCLRWWSIGVGRR